MGGRPETWTDNNYNCNLAARAQMKKAGVETNGSSNVIQTDVDNSAQTSYVNNDGIRINRPKLIENKVGCHIHNDTIKSKKTCYGWIKGKY